MHARVTHLTGSPDKIEAGITNFRDNVVPFTREEGKGAVLLVDRESGSAMSITLWEDEQAMAASEERANQVRSDVADQMQASAAARVERYEVAVFET